MNLTRPSCKARSQSRAAIANGISPSASPAWATTASRTLNSAGFPLVIGQTGSVTNGMFAPQVTSLVNDTAAGLVYRHIKLPPGDYLVYARRNEVLYTWERVRIKDGDQITLDLLFDLTTAGDVAFTLRDSEGKRVSDDSNRCRTARTRVEETGNVHGGDHVKAGEKTVTVNGIRAGNYRALFGKIEKDVEVIAGKSTAVQMAAED